MGRRAVDGLKAPRTRGGRTPPGSTATKRVGAASLKRDARTRSATLYRLRVSVLALAVIVLVAGGCASTVPPPSSTPTTLPSVTTLPSATTLPATLVEIVTHCGLAFPRVEYDGQVWRFDVEDDGNPPEGWGLNTTVVKLVPGDDGPTVIGPDDSRWELIPAPPDESPGVCF
jgi:hypothetical protein